MNNIVYDYFKNASTKSTFPQAFLIGNVNFDAFKEQLESILENFFFNTKLDIYNNPDIFILRQNETLITKNNVKELLLNLSLTSQFSNLKIYIIEDCEKLTDNVYNALLKTLEEPEKGIYAFLLSSNITAVKPTIASRCQKFFVSSDVENECKKDYFDFAKKIVYDIEEKGIVTIASNCDIYNNIKDRMEFNNILINILDIYREKFFKIVNNNITDEDLFIIIKNNTKKLLEKILIINDNINYSKKNLNKNLCIDRFLIDMWRCEK